MNGIIGNSIITNSTNEIWNGYREYYIYYNVFRNLQV